MNFFEILKELLAQSGFAALTWQKLCNDSHCFCIIIPGN